MVNQSIRFSLNFLAYFIFLENETNDQHFCDVQNKVLELNSTS